MSVYSMGATSGVAGTGAATWSGGSRRMGGGGAVARMQSAIGAVSQLLNVSASDLTKQLGSGQSLTSVAAAKGISADAVVSTIAKAVSTSVPQGRTPLSGDLLQQISARIAGSTGVPAGFSTGTA